MNPTPSQPERPEPPEGYELNDSVDHLPEGAMIRSRWYRTDNWGLASLRGKDIPPEYHQNWWVSIPATRTPAPEAVAGEKCTNHYSDGSKIFLNRDCCYPSITPHATPPVEADKDAEIAAMTPGTEPHQVIARLKHEKKNLITVIDESTRNQRSLESELTTARATIAERDKRIAFLEEARDGSDKERDELTARIAELERQVACVNHYIPLAIRDSEAFVKMEAALAEARKDSAWRPIDTAPKDGTKLLVYAKEMARPPLGCEKLPPIISECAWHEDAGFCVCQIRSVTHWMPLPATPLPETKDGQL